MSLASRWAGLGERTRARLGAVALVLVTLVAYAPVAGCGWVWDDDKYVTANPTLVEPGGLARIWTDPAATPQYYPLVHTTFWLERGLWGFDPAGFHLVNVLIHGLAAVALWRLLARLGLPAAWAAAAVFAVHPVGVESVAWITERKNTLSLLLALLAAHRLLPLATGEGEDPPRWSGRAWAQGALLLGLGLLSKTVVCTLPAVMLVLAWWRRGRVERWQLAAFVPLLALGAAAGLYTAKLEKEHVGALSEAFDLSRADRALIMGRAAWFYLGKLAWPLSLSFSYERWTLEPWRLAAWAWPAGVVVALCGLWLARARLGRGPLAVALIYGGVLLPGLGIVDVYPFKYSFVADHFQYHAMPAVLTLLVVGVASALARRRAAEAGPWLAAVAVATLGLLTLRQLGAWKDEMTLWRDTVRVTPTSFLALSNLGVQLGIDGKDLLASPATEAEGLARLRESRRCIHRALPRSADEDDLVTSLVNLSRTERDLDDHRAAAALLRWAADLRPRNADLLAEAGAEALTAGDWQAAQADLRAALVIAPRHRAARLALAQVLVDATDPAVRDPVAGQAIADALVLETRSLSPDALAVRARALFARGDRPGAIEAAQDALRLARAAARSDLVAAIERDLARYRAP